MKILCVRNDKLGDFVLTLPLYQVLKRHLPDIHITVLVAGYVAPLAQALPEIDNVIVDDGDNWSLLKKVRAQNFDISLTLFSTTRVGWILFLSGIKKRIAPATKIAQIFHNSTKKQRRSLVKMCEFEYNLDLLSLLDEKIDTHFTRPVIEVKKSSAVEHIKRIALHPGSGGSSIGNISKLQYLELAQMIDEEGSYEVVFTFGPDETVLMQEIKSLSANRFCYYQSNEGIYQFCTFLSDISLFISTSTGTMHLAAAVNIPTFSFFGNHLIASSKRWAGLNETKLQYNFDFSADKRADYEQIKNRLKDFLDGK